MSQVNPMRGVRTLLICLALPVAGEVAEVDDYGFVSTHVIAIEAPPELLERNGIFDSAEEHGLLDETD